MAPGTSPDGRSALMLVAARLRRVAGTKWGTRRYMSMEKLKVQEEQTKVTQPGKGQVG